MIKCDDEKRKEEDGVATKRRKIRDEIPQDKKNSDLAERLGTIAAEKDEEEDYTELIDIFNNH